MRSTLAGGSGAQAPEKFLRFSCAKIDFSKGNFRFSTCFRVVFSARISCFRPCGPALARLVIFFMSAKPAECCDTLCFLSSQLGTARVQGRAAVNGSEVDHCERAKGA